MVNRYMYKWQGLQKKDTKMNACIDHTLVEVYVIKKTIRLFFFNIKTADIYLGTYNVLCSRNGLLDITHGS